VAGGGLKEPIAAVIPTGLLRVAVRREFGPAWPDRLQPSAKRSKPAPDALARRFEVEEFCVVRCEVADDVVVAAEILHASATDSRSDAEAAAEAAAKAHQSFGFDATDGYWWGKNTGSVTNRFVPTTLADGHRLVEELSSS
jgi:hypothetical protein